jgi:MoxR-like ATPase
MPNEPKLDELLRLVDSMKDGEPVDEVRIADSRDGTFYRHGEQTRLALKIALITARPLLLVGPPGCGKSSLAPYAARNLRLRPLSYTVTENAEASDLLWRVDYLKQPKAIERRAGS